MDQKKKRNERHPEENTKAKGISERRGIFKKNGKHTEKAMGQKTSLGGQKAQKGGGTSGGKGGGVGPKGGGHRTADN